MSGAANRRKGHQFERDLAAHFDVPTVRSLAGGGGAHDDLGDLWVGPWAIEAKNVSQWRVDYWFATHEAKLRNSKMLPALIIKRRQRPLTDSLVVVRLGDWDEGG